VTAGTSATRSALECLLFGVPIEPEDAGLLCVHFQPKSEHREDGTMNELTTAIC